MTEKQRQAQKKLRVSIGTFSDEVLRNGAKALDMMIQRRGADDSTEEWAKHVFTILKGMEIAIQYMKSAIAAELLEIE